MELDLNVLREICKPENIEITMHAAKRLEQRNITLDDIMECVMNGEIVEQYPDDYPFPSCLILGSAKTKLKIHTVIGSDLTTLWIITAYYPSPDKWESDLKTRKENEL